MTESQRLPACASETRTLLKELTELDDVSITDRILSAHRKEFQRLWDEIDAIRSENRKWRNS